MIELRFSVSEADYEAMIQALAGGRGSPMASMAVMAARSMTEAAKEEMLVKYLNANAEHLSRQMESAAGAKGVHVKVSGASASVVHR